MTFKKNQCDLNLSLATSFKVKLTRSVNRSFETLQLL